MEKIEDRLSKVGTFDRACYRLLPFRREIVEKNIETAFGQELNLKSKQRLAKLFYGQICRGLLESALYPLFSRSYLRDSLRIVGEKNLHRALERKKGVLILSGHFANWEWAALAWAANRPQMAGRMHCIRRPIAPFFRKIFFARFEKLGWNIIAKQGSLFRITKALHENGLVLYPFDQYASVSSGDGIRCPFFGRPTGTFRSVALLARRTDCAVVPVAIRRISFARHEIEFLPELKWKSDDSVDREIYLNTSHYNAAIEGIIRRHPSQWLWLHRRWKEPSQRGSKNYLAGERVR